MQVLSPSRISQSERVQAVQAHVMEWLTAGLQPRQLAFTLALGFAIGCIPLLGVTTGICALLALAFGLNMPAIQAANWVAMPFQVVLLFPFMRLGQWMFPGHGMALDRSHLMAQITAAPWNATVQMGGLFGYAVLAWGLMAAPALLLLTLMLTPVLHRVARRMAAPAQ